MKKIILSFCVILLCTIFPKINAQNYSKDGAIGANIYKEPYWNRTIIINTIPSSPASDIPIGSEIIKIDDKKIYFYSESKIINKIRGPLDSKVKLQIKNPNGNIQDYELTRVSYDTLKYDEKFEYFWGQIAPEEFLRIPLYEDLLAVKSKLSIFDNKVTKNDLHWGIRKSKFTREYNYCLKQSENVQNACFEKIVQINTDKNKDETTPVVNSTDNSDKWLTGLILLNQLGRTIDVLDNNYRQSTQFYNNLSTQKRLFSINQSIQQQNYHLQRINNTLNGAPNSVIRGEQRLYY